MAGRFRSALAVSNGELAEKKMMGGLTFLLNGNMVGGVSGTGQFMFRIGKDNPAAGRLKGGTPVVMGDRTMPGFYYVAADCPDPVFAEWAGEAAAFAGSLPPK